MSGVVQAPGMAPAEPHAGRPWQFLLSVVSSKVAASKHLTSSLPISAGWRPARHIGVKSLPQAVQPQPPCPRGAAILVATNSGACDTRLDAALELRLACACDTCVNMMSGLDWAGPGQRGPGCRSLTLEQLGDGTELSPGWYKAELRRLALAAMATVRRGG